ncbi:MAG: glycosyltransferase family 4 protein [Caldilineaceae bacterium]|nr:glycosyltransferase family 4 protein [Caldilineaceae bacterium]
MSKGMLPADTLRVRIAMIYPLSITLGGFEHQAIQTCRALQVAGVDAQLLDWNKADDEFDILHLFGASAHWYEISQAAAKKSRIVVTALGAPARWKQPLFRWLGWAAMMGGRILRQQSSYEQAYRSLRCASYIVCLNEFQRRFYQSAYQLPTTKTAVVPNGVPSSRYTGDAALFTAKYGIRDYVLFTGNIVERKRPLQLARVLKRCNWPGVFIGGTLNSASERAYAQEFESALKDAPNLIWIKGLAYDDPLLDSAYAGARALCLPSADESQPLSAMEAMAAGAPVILADLPYAHQAPFEKTVRCRLDDDLSLEHAIRMITDAPAQHRHVLPEEYSWDKVAQQLVAVYQRVMEPDA